MEAGEVSACTAGIKQCEEEEGTLALKGNVTFYRLWKYMLFDETVTLSGNL